jgi:hypothetical protein
MIDLNILRSITPIQNDLLMRMLSSKRLFNMLDMGMGKTLSSLIALKLNLNIDKTLLISKPNIFKSWVDDNKKFKINLNILEIKGNPNQRLKQIKSKEFDNADIICVSVFNLEWFFNYIGIKLNNFNCLVIDESSLFKNHDTKRYKSLWKYLKFFEYRYILNGTPKDSFISLYNQVAILDNKERLGSITQFRRKYQIQHPYIKNVWEDNIKMQDELINAIKDISFNRDNKSEFELKYNYIAVELNEDTQAKLKLLKDKLYLDEEGNINNIDNFSQYLAMINKTILSDENRIKTVANKIKSVPSALIVCNLVDFRYKLKEMLGDNAIVYQKNKNHEKDFNEGKIKYLLIHTSNIAYGVNLQYSQSKDIFYISPYGVGLDSYIQLNKRLARRGNKNKIININHFYSDELEFKYFKKLEKRRFNLREFLKSIANRR